MSTPTTESKISQLKQDLLRGRKMTPLLAWKWHHISMNTYHRSIWALAHKQGLPIRYGRVVRKENHNSVHWIERKDLKK